MTRATPEQTKEYKKLAQQKTPPRPILRNVLAAFIVGGVICLVGQVILTAYTGVLRIPQKEAVPLTSGTMILLGALLTGIGVYDEIGRVGGMGSAIPITGFANSIVSPALEFKREGFILGLSAKMFVIAGPVIVYGLVTSVAVGLLKYVFERGL